MSVTTISVCVIRPQRVCVYKILPSPTLDSPESAALYQIILDDTIVTVTEETLDRLFAVLPRLRAQPSSGEIQA